MSGIPVDVVRVDSIGVLNAMMYAPTTEADLQFFRGQSEPTMWANLTNAGQQFMAQVSTYQQQFEYNAVNSQAAAIAQQTGMQTHHQYIVYGYEAEHIRQLNLAGQRAIMSDPHIRQLYDEGRIDGYSSTWTNYQPDVPVHMSYDHQRIYDGLVMDDGTYRQFSDIHDHNEPELSLFEKSNAHALIQQARHWLEQGIDVTNSYDPDATVQRW